MTYQCNEFQKYYKIGDCDYKPCFSINSSKFAPVPFFQDALIFFFVEFSCHKRKHDLDHIYNIVSQQTALTH